MKEWFDKRSLTGNINVACKFENQPTRYWTTTKQNVAAHIVKIVNAYRQQGETLTLRQLHYQFVGHVPGYVNHDTAYKKLGSILDDLRYSGVIPWDSFEDRGRKPSLPYYVKDIPDALQDAIDTYRLDRQEGQKVYVELWTEKDALSAILGKSTRKYHIHLVVNKGYTSSTAAYEAYRRIVDQIKSGKKATILYFGDHDPSGLDMVRDIRERLLFFLTRGDELKTWEGVQKWWDENGFNIYDLNSYLPEKFYTWFDEGGHEDEVSELFDHARAHAYLDHNDLFEVKHIGLTMEQVRQYRLPENPTKLTDSRAGSYVRQYGRHCWEVDALDLQVLRRIVEENIEAIIDVPLYESVLQRERDERAQLVDIVDGFKN